MEAHLSCDDGDGQIMVSLRLLAETVIRAFLEDQSDSSVSIYQ